MEKGERSLDMAVLCFDDGCGWIGGARICEDATKVEEMYFTDSLTLMGLMIERWKLHIHSSIHLLIYVAQQTTSTSLPTAISSRAMASMASMSTSTHTTTTTITSTRSISEPYHHNRDNFFVQSFAALETIATPQVIIGSLLLAFTIPFLLHYLAYRAKPIQSPTFLIAGPQDAGKTSFLTYVSIWIFLYSMVYKWYLQRV